MFKVNSRKCLNNLSIKTLKANKIRNIVAIMAAMLTAIMFTSLFTIGASILESMQNTTMRQVGTCAHGGFKFISQKEYEKIKADSKVKDISYNIIIGFGDNDEFSKSNVEVRYTEEKAARWGFTYPKVGTLPKEKMDVAASTKVLDLLGLPYELGVELPLKVRLDNKIIEDKFKLCGYWESDSASSAEEVFLSKEYQEINAPTWEGVKEAKSDFTYLSGSINPSIFFSSSWNIEKQIHDLKERCGFDRDVNEGVNWAYATSEVDFGSLILALLILLLIITSGYLIVYNIFNISVSGDIRFYGLLKTIGMTNKQLKKIVIKQAMILGLVGSILGMILGYLISCMLVPIVMNVASDGISCIISANPFIFITSGIFTLLTVFISCIKPCKLVSKISPVSAVRFEEENLTSKKKTITKMKKTKKVTMFSMAKENVKRSPKKTISVILSLSLSVIMLNSTITLVRGFDMDKYIESNVVSDFYLTDKSVASSISQMSVFNGVSRTLQDEIKNHDGIKNFGSIYMKEAERNLSSFELKRIHEIWNDFEKELKGTHYEDMLDIIDNNKKTFVHIYGIDDFIIPKMELVKGMIDIDKFKTGNYVIVTTFSSDGKGEYYNIGDKVVIDFENGKTKEYEVMALGDIPYALGPHHSHLYDIFFTLPACEFIKETGETGALSSAFDVFDEDYESINEYVKDVCMRSELYYKSKETYEESFNEARNTYLIVGTILSFILGLIGLLNFINSCITSISSRRKELATLQAVGMTSCQLKEMLIFEGLCYALITMLVTIILGVPAGYLIVIMISRQLWFFTYRFTIIPVIIALIVFVIFAILIPLVCYKVMCTRSIVERIKQSEE